MMYCTGTSTGVQAAQHQVPELVATGGQLHMVAPTGGQLQMVAPTLHACGAIYTI